MKHDLWFDLEDKAGNKNNGRVRLMLQWVYSKVQYFEKYLMKWEQTLLEDVKEREAIEGFIQQLESPFGFLNQVICSLIILGVK
jgi:hypothetical protein